MPIETTVTRCGNCGATLERQPGVESITCAYCEQTTWLAPTTHATRASAVGLEAADLSDPLHAAPATLHQRLLRGPIGEHVGRALGLSASQAQLGDAALNAHAIWPVSADASTTFGGSWSPSSMVGPPRVFPRYGDIGGAWAPAPRVSPVEWVEVRFAEREPARAVRVFETNQSGSTFAVVDTSRGESLLYAGPVSSVGSARVLEVAVEPPRVIESLRIYVANRGWTEIDTVGLLSSTPLPAARQAPLPSAARSRGAGCAVIAIVAVALIGVLAGVMAWVARDPAAPRRSAPAPGPLVAGGAPSFSSESIEALAARGVVWSDGLVDFSSQYSDARNAAHDVVGPPDVYPRSGDLDGAWASRSTDGGEEWVTVRFAAPILATAVVWVETHHPGAVARIDDVSGGGTTTLWQGTMDAPAGGAVVGELPLDPARPISAIRLLLDTRRVSGWNEIDAIGLVPARASQ